MSVAWRVLTKDCLFLFIFIEIYTLLVFANTRENSQFISSGEVATSSAAHSWCLNHSSRLVEITSEELWVQTEEFVKFFNLTTQYQYILNIVGKNLSSWQWITGTNFTAATQFDDLKHDEEMYAHLSRNGESKIIIKSSQPDYPDGNCLLSYICEYNSTKERCNNATAVSFDRSCYVFHEHENVSWFGAYHACKNKNGRLATFPTIPGQESNFTKKLTIDRRYWIGLFRHKWSWDKSGDLLTFTNWDREHVHNYGGSSLRVDPNTRKWFPDTRKSSTASSTFVCLKEVITTMATTSTAVETTTPKTKKTETTTLSPASQLTTAGLPTETTMSETNEKNSKSEGNTDGNGYQMMWIIGLACGILLVALAVIVGCLCVRKKNKSAKPNETKQSNQNKTSNTSALDYARVNFSELNGSDRNGNMESKKGTTSDPVNPIYGQVVNQPDVDRKEPAQSSLVYADLEFIQKNIREDPTYSNQELETQPPNLQIGPMGDVYAMVQK